jgi:hypothetical protein
MHSFSVGLILISTESCRIFVNSRISNSGTGTVEEQFNYNSLCNVLLYGASETGNPLTVRGKILQPILVKSAPDLFRIKFIPVVRRCCVNIISSLHSTTVSQYQLMETGGGGYRMLGFLCMCDSEAVIRLLFTQQSLKN